MKELKTETFCEICRKKTPFAVKENIPMSGILDGKEYYYSGAEALCEVCGKPVYVGEIETSNFGKLYAAYREANGIIPLEAVREIPAKYAIGKRPLSIVLGWGEQTFSRYCEGAVPTRQYSDVLKRIEQSPKYYLDLLEANKSNITETAYEKSKKAVLQLLLACGANIDKVAEYIVSRGGDITPLALQKLLYYVQGFYFAFFGSFLFAEDCEAWAHGPVYRNIYFKYKDYSYNPIDEPAVYSKAAFSTTEKAVIDSVAENLGCYSGTLLEKFTHMETPWLLTRGDLPEGAPSDKVIDKELIGNYFSLIRSNNKMLSPADIRNYADQMRSRL